MHFNFPQLAMAKFSEQYKDQNLIAMHNTNPQPFTQNELEHIIGRSFAEILKDTPLGFAADAGTTELRQVLAQSLYETIKAEEIISHAGAQEALFCAYHALLEPGDRVLVVAPVFEPLVIIPRNMGCIVNSIELDTNNNWQLDLAAVQRHFKQGCRLFVINFPHNPTGAQLTKNQLDALIKLCAKYDVWLLSDEVFRGLEHSTGERLPAVADIYAKGISVGVVSKGFAIPGLRVGWLVCKHKQLLDRVLDVKGYLSICNSQIDEKLLTFIMRRPEKLLQRHLAIILKNKELLEDLNVIINSNVELFIPKAGCCAFIQIKDKIESGQLVEKLAQKTGYLLYPSSLFLTNENAMRIGFGSDKFRAFIDALQDEKLN